jgi:hypothetical protein
MLFVQRATLRYVGKFRKHVGLASERLSVWIIPGRL